MKNIIETAIDNADFSTLVTAITVFAPTNEAFAKIPEETLKELLADKTKLTSVLTYHVVAGKVMSEDIAKITEEKTVQGSNIKIDTKDGVMINNAKVTKVDIECLNGVIHVIDTVLMPA